MSIAVALALATAALLAPTASAGTVHGYGIQPSVLQFEAAAGETNTVTVAADAADVNQYGDYARITVTDTTAPLVVGSSCQSVDIHTAICTAGSGGFTSAELVLGDGDDKATIGPLDRSYVFGNEGNDTLTGSDVGSDQLKGGPGDDTLSGRGGIDSLDQVWLGTETVEEVQSGADTYSGGAGNDHLSYRGRTEGVAATVDGVANDGGVGEHDNVGSDIEDLQGGAGDDFMAGGTAADILDGAEGNDRILGEGGADTIDGGAGNDRIDGGAGNDLVEQVYGDDDVHGGAGTDTLTRWDSLYTSTSLDDVANDGPAGAAQNIHSDVENVTVYYRATVWGSAAANDLRVRKPDEEVCYFGLSSPGSEMHGGAGNDTLTAYGADDRLYGDDGMDTITGGCGTDYLEGGKGFDVIDSRDGDPTDVVSCGAGVDRVTADKGDRVAKDCEIVNRIV